VPRGVDHASALAQIEAVWLGRDLINTPRSDMGPQELEDAARQLARTHGAESRASSATTCWCRISP
jgi:leucyl aminopeptidase